MHAVNLIARALRCRTDPYEDVKGFDGSSLVDGTCAVTGQYAPCRPRKDLIGKSFTNLDLLAAPESMLVSDDVCLALGYKWERMSSWICDGSKFSRLDRQGVRDIVLRGEYSDIWCGYATTSYKKHGALWTPINSGGKRVWRFEAMSVDCSDHDALLHIWTRLNTEIRKGIGRSCMETLVPNGFAIKNAGVAAWIDFENWARPLHQGALYKFMCYLLPSVEELKAEAAKEGQNV